MPREDKPTTALEVISARYRFNKSQAYSLKHLRAFGRALLERAANRIEDEKVDADDSEEESDYAYNRAIDDAKAAIRALYEKGKTK